MRHLEQQGIARGVTETVVDRLEVVQVHHERRVAAGAACQSLVGVLETVAKERSIRQAGQRIVKGLMLQLALQPDPVRDVARAYDHCVPAVEDDLSRIYGDIEDATRLGRVADALEVRASSPHGVQVVLQLIAILERAYLRERQGEEFGSRVPVHRERRIVDTEERQV